MPEGGYPYSECGDHKIGFATCGRKWINGVVPPENRLPMRPIPPEEQGPYPDDAFENFKRKRAFSKHIPQEHKNPSKTHLADSSGGLWHDLMEHAYVKTVAGKQCSKAGNCCKTITIKVECAAWINEARERSMQQPPEDLKRAGEIVFGYTGPVFNPCGTTEVVKCE